MNNKAQFFPLRDDNPRVGGVAFVNWIFIILNVGIFLYSLSNFEAIILGYGFVPANASFLTLITSMFLHGGIAHLLGNMWFLYIFGDNVEDRMGHFAYLIFYLVAGIAASLLHFLTNLGSMIPAVGASGAISGVLGAYLVFFPKAGVYISGGMGVGRVSAMFMLILWFVFQLFSGFLSGPESGVAFFAHIGGFIFGVVVALIWRAVRRK
jgi:membrane associated rhomboid family serine protease